MDEGILNILISKQTLKQDQLQFNLGGEEPVDKGSEDSSRGFLGCDTVWCCGRIPTFQRSITTQKTST